MPLATASATGMIICILQIREVQRGWVTWPRTHQWVNGRVWIPDQVSCLSLRPMLLITGPKWIGCSSCPQAAAGAVSSFIKYFSGPPCSRQWSPFLFLQMRRLRPGRGVSFVKTKVTQYLGQSEDWNQAGPRSSPPGCLHLQPGSWISVFVFLSPKAGQTPAASCLPSPSPPCLCPC